MTADQAARALRVMEILTDLRDHEPAEQERLLAAIKPAQVRFLSGEIWPRLKSLLDRTEDVLGWTQEGGR